MVNFFMVFINFLCLFFCFEMLIRRFGDFLFLKELFCWLEYCCRYWVGEVGDYFV